ncbi:ATP-dependent DNA helicase RecG [Peptoniphilus sp. BV3AC2]|uniref:ATP-dependent DNA helicase RecG n=1 Tax=Peptoniphilus sp. BV3AC2 TaxID=1111133 RepID=UPI0003B82973|nr:ATP-dependent DNA helicase RecG [Peptoniphilus sp. BV3AC2]ERT64903.1 ATP-dependent DNA helicase RecG [Peptoniphilus sp. BV3AC2]
MKLFDKLDTLNGVGPKKKSYLEAMGLETISDLAEYFPIRFIDSTNMNPIKDLVEGEFATIKAEVVQVVPHYHGRLKRLDVIVTDGFNLKISFFNQNFLSSKFLKGEQFYFYGKVSRFGNNLTMTSPKFENVKRKKVLGSIIPVYQQSKDINNKELIKLTDQVLKEYTWKNVIPEEILEKYKLYDMDKTMRELHRPKSQKTYGNARNSYSFYEILTYLLALSTIKKDREETDIKLIEFEIEEFLKTLPFTLTDSQMKVIEEVKGDLKSGYRVDRLIQGDVGSGKTVVAMAIMYLFYKNGFQSAIMAPTEILATQHYNSFKNTFDKLGINVALLIGSMKKSQKDEVLEDLKSGKVDMIVGTHALISENVEFKNLGISIVDEQHRFGVLQRKNLSDKGVHTIVMTATPIPRTLALVMYQDLQVSTIDTPPAGRLKIQTATINENGLLKALEFIEKELKEGRQAYIICPMIDENEMLDLNSVKKVYKEIKKYFKDYNVGLLHGQMKPDEKDRQMEDFEKNKINVLVSTTVVEVGVNVPNATVMMVVNAERFGLSQLHQLRGRVGRGTHQGYCILYNKSESEIASMRMKVMVESTDGFYISKKDLELRGSGDIFGVRQSGFMGFILANPIKDKMILKYAALEAKNIYRDDPDFIKPEHLQLKISVDRLISRKFNC